MAEPEVVHRTRAELDAGIDEIRRAPRDAGSVALLVARPGVDLRRPVDAVALVPNQPLPGDRWSPQALVEGAVPRRQLTLMNVRVARLVAGPKERWPLTGDNLQVDFDLSEAHLPPGSRLRVGAAVLEVSHDPHEGCSKFAARFGKDALAFVSSPEGRALRLRGLLAHVVEGGIVRVGDPVRLA